MAEYDIIGGIVSPKAQKELEIGAIGGKDSMSGSFEKLDVPPTLISFAVTTDNVKNVVSPEFKSGGHKVCVLVPNYSSDGLPEAESLKENFNTVTELIRRGAVCAVYTPTFGGIAEGIFKMCIGNGFGFAFDDSVSMDDIFGYRYGSFILEMTCGEQVGICLGLTTESAGIYYGRTALSLEALQKLYEDKLEPVYPCNIITEEKFTVPYSYERKSSVAKPRISFARPKALIPVFPGTNCEYDTARALEKAGAEAEIIVIKNLTQADISHSVERFAKELKTAQLVVIPGGFSGGDEPDGSAKFITSFFRNAAIRDEVEELLGKRDGLMLGICNGFQALIKLGLVPFGHIMDTDESFPTLSFNTIGRHQSKLVRTAVSSNLSPWLMNTKVGEIFTVPISHGEGRFLADDELVKKLGANGQIATQYVGLSGNPTQDIRFNPNGSVCAIEGITSPDGRVFGKMGHSERIGEGLYKNVEGLYDIGLFASAVEYYK